MSAFLSYSNSKRGSVKAKNPNIGNAEVSRILARMWKEAPEEERKMHIDKEFELRQAYKNAIAIWRHNADEELKAARKKREDIAIQQAEEGLERRHSVDSEEHQDSTDTLQPNSPSSVAASVAVSACPGPAAYAAMGPFGMGFNGCGDDSTLPHVPPPNYGFMGPPSGLGSGASGVPGSGSGTNGLDFSVAYGAMPQAAFPGGYAAEYGMRSSAFGMLEVL